MIHRLTVVVLLIMLAACGTDTGTAADTSTAAASDAGAATSADTSTVAGSDAGAETVGPRENSDTTAENMSDAAEGGGDVAAADGDGDEGEEPIQDARLVISEVMIPATGNGESYIELFNPGAVAYDLTGCIVSDDGSSAITLPVLIIDPADYVVLIGSDNVSATFSFASGGNETPDFWYSPDVFENDAPDDEILLTCDDILIDRVVWTDYQPAEPNNPMQSLTLNPLQMDALANDDPDNWCHSSSYFNFSSRGTPRRPNDACE